MSSHPATGKHQSDRFPVVALGASAGGLKALEAFFAHVPAESGIAFIIAQHLSPDHETSLPELLARHTDMRVELAAENLRVEANHVYILPPNATLTIRDNHLHVAPPEQARGLRMPIDSLFQSLAEAHGDHAVCILLSGTGSDGTQGLRAIKEYGGMAMAQSVESAQYDAMVRSAIATGLVDHILPVEQMPAKLKDYVAYLANGDFSGQTHQISTQMSKIHAVLLRQTGHDFTQYKDSTVSRRLQRRMKALQIDNVDQYVEALDRTPEEANRLFNDLLIAVTQFFRNPEAFAALATQVIPKLFHGKGQGEQVRACVVGCASGEEAYSIGMMLFEYASTLQNAPKIQLFATDIDERSLETARKGRYPDSIAEQVTPQRLERFFIKQDGVYQVKRALRESIIFSNHSFIKDPPFSRLDLIACRNVMIYLGVELQQRVLPLFHYALREGGYLFLGPSENVTSHQQLFKTIDKRNRIFQRNSAAKRAPLAFPLSEVIRPQLAGMRPLRDDSEKGVPKNLERLVLEKYGPAFVVVKENGDAVYFSGRTSRYFEQPVGSPESNVVNMAREGLRIPLRAALHKASAGSARVVQKQLSIQTGDAAILIDLTVEPLSALHAANLYIVVVEESTHLGPSQVEAHAVGAGSEEIIRHLEGELRAAQDNAQAMFEELESSNEELKSANGEYQSTIEELESSKEELNSFNEELQTVNAEVARKCAELDHANGDLQNLLTGTQIATIFLDRNLRIRVFTPAAGDVFRLISSDVGRPITDLAARFSNPDLAEDIGQVITTLEPRERQLTAEDDRYFQMRIMPYRTIENVIDGVVLTFTDVGTLIHAHKALNRLNDDLRHFAYAASHDLREPLRMVTSFTQLLGREYRGKLQGDADKYIGFAVEGAQRMESLLQGMRDYWSVGEGKVADTVPADVGRALQAAIADLRLRIQETGAAITHDPLPVLLGDELSFVVLFQNLIGNALKYRRNDTAPRIHVSAHRKSLVWQFTVSDNGIGIEHEYQEAIFAPFKRLHGPEYSGTGIGLAICQKIVSRSGGRIWVDSIFGQGSAFRFTIPARKEHL